MIEHFITILRRADVALDYRQIEEILWLSGVLPKSTVEEGAESPEAPVEVAENRNRDHQPLERPATQSRAADQTRNLYTSSSAATGAQFSVSRVRVPAASALPEALLISRALRPLSRRVKSKYHFILDEDATVEQSARSRMITPVFTPASERWFDVALVIEDAPSMVVWRQTIRELAMLLERQGAFRDVRQWRLRIESGKARLIEPDGATRSVKALNDPNSRRLVVLLSDCASPCWHDGSLSEVLLEWGARMPVVIGHMLSERLWRHTATGEASVIVASMTPGAANRLLDPELPWWDDEIAGRMPFPIVSLNHELIGGWANLLTSVGAKYKATLLPTEPSATVASEPQTAEERIDLFRSVVSDEAYNLAVFLSVMPLTLPVMRLVHQAMIRNARQEQLAEVLLGRIIRRKTSPDEQRLPEEIEYEFYPGVREILQGDIQYSELDRIFQSISNFVDRRIGSTRDFVAWIKDSEGDAQISASALSFAEIAIPALARMGLGYLLEDIEPDLRPLIDKAVVIVEKSGNLAKPEDSKGTTVLPNRQKVKSLIKEAESLSYQRKPTESDDLYRKAIELLLAEGTTWHEVTEIVKRDADAKESRGLFLSELRDHESVFARQRVAQLLGQIGGQQAIKVLLEALKTDNFDSVRGSAAEALGQIGGNRFAEALLEALNTDNSGFVRGSAAQALGQIRSEFGIEALLNALKTDVSDFVRGSAAQALGQIGGNQFTEALLVALNTDNSDSVRGSAAKALGQIGGELSIKALIKALNTDNSDDVRWRVAKALGHIGGKRAIKALLEALKTDNSDSVRGHATYALARIGGRQAIEALLDALNTGNSDDVRWRAARALGEIGGQRAIQALLKILNPDNSTLVRGSAKWALGQIGGQQAIEALVDALKTENSDLGRWEAAKALARIGSEQAISALIENLQTENYPVRLSVVEALDDVQSDQVVETLSRLARTDADERVRQAALKALEKLGAAIEKEIGRVRIFLSHASADHQRANDIYSFLAIHGFEVESSDYSLSDRLEWDSQFEKWIWKYDLFLVCLSRNNFEEMNNSEGRIPSEMHHPNISLITVRLEERKIPEGVERWQCVNFYEEDGKDRLLHAIRSELRRRQQSSETQWHQLHSRISDALTDKLAPTDVLNLVDQLREMTAIEVCRVMNEAGITYVAGDEGEKLFVNDSAVEGDPVSQGGEQARRLLTEAQRRCLAIKSPEFIRSLIPLRGLNSKLIAETERVAQLVLEAVDAPSASNFITLDTDNGRTAALRTAVDLSKGFRDGLLFIDFEGRKISQSEVMLACLNPFVRLGDDSMRGRLPAEERFIEVFSQKRVLIIFDNVSDPHKLEPFSQLPRGSVVIAIEKATRRQKRIREAQEYRLRLKKLEQDYGQVVSQLRGIEGERNLRNMPAPHHTANLKTQRRSLLQGIRELEAQLRALNRDPMKTLNELIERAIVNWQRKPDIWTAGVEMRISELRNTESEHQQAIILGQIASAFLQLSDFTIAIEFCNFALEKTPEDLGIQRNIFFILADSHISLDQYEEAEDVLQKAIENAEAEDDRRAESIAHTQLGLLYLRTGAFDRSLASHSEALEIARSVPDRNREGEILLLRGNVRLQMGDFDAARGLYHQALSIFTQLDDRWNEADAKERISHVAEVTGDYDVAIQFAEQSLAISADIQSPGSGRLRETLKRLRRMKAEQAVQTTTFSPNLAIEDAPDNATNLGTYAVFLMNQRRDYDEAERFFNRAIEADPKHARNLGNYAAFLMNQRCDYDEAGRYFKLAIEADPDDAANLGNYALFIENHRHDNDEAERYYKLSIETNPNNANNLGNYATFLSDHRHNYGEAERYYKLAIKAAPNNANTLGNYALFIENHRHDYAEAERYYKLAIEADPKHADSLGNYATFFVKHLRDYDEAERFFKLAIEAAPNNAPNLGNYALFLESHRHDYDEAEQYYKLAIEADPKHASYLGNYATFLMNHRHDYAEAKRYYKLAIEADPNNANILSNYAAFLERNQHDYDEAERFFKLAIEADPNNANILGNYATFLVKHRRDFDEAERVYKLAIDADPKHANNIGNYAVFLERYRHDYDGAERVYKLAIDADPKHANNLGNYALFLEKSQRNPDDIERYYKLVIEADPKHPRNLGAYALFLLDHRRNYDEAERYYKLAIEADPNDALNLGNYATFLMNHRRAPNDAGIYFKMAIEADPNDATHLGNYALFIEKIQRDPDEAERYYKLAIEADPNNANNLGNYALFLENYRHNYGEAERYYKLAIEADPKHANSLGNYATFLVKNRRDYDEAERFFKLAIEAASNNARNLGNYALFLKNQRRDYDKAEQYYKLAIEAGPNNANIFSSYAIFLQAQRHDYDEAERYYRQAMALNLGDPNSRSNFAQMLLAQGRKEEGREMIASSFGALASNSSPGLLSELWFYRYAHFWNEEPATLSELKRVLLSGDRSPGWNLQSNIDRAEADGHPNVELLKTLARVISEEAEIVELEADGDWRAA